jgi:hypothetical protein
MIALKSCPRCHGDLFYEEFLGETELVCPVRVPHQFRVNPTGVGRSPSKKGGMSRGQGTYLWQCS